tara:strand:- start:411 stop:1028 length:618 start_codon:yes stop_codon:yes gene_type:complete
MTKKATDIFSEWASIGRDEGMQKNHLVAVRNMFQMLIKDQFKSFSFIDAGCGNGWAVREMLKNHLCVEAIGVDGAREMIQKAKYIDPNGEYIFSDLMEWKPKKLVDAIHSMEVVYYFNDPKELILHMKDKWLKPGGYMIMGLDFYKENIFCHTWPKKLNIKMTLLSIEEWSQILKNCGLGHVKSYQTNSTDSFAGTLVLYAKKLK